SSRRRHTRLVSDWSSDVCSSDLRTSLRAPDLFGFYLGLGITMMVCVQAFINMSVVLGLLPTKGIPLPFLSYGGSSFVVMLAAVEIGRASCREGGCVSAGGECGRK